MVMLVIQSAILIFAAFIVGAILGCYLVPLFSSRAGEDTVATPPGANALENSGAAMQASPLSLEPDHIPAPADGVHGVHGVHSDHFTDAQTRAETEAARAGVLRTNPVASHVASQQASAVQSVGGEKADDKHKAHGEVKVGERPPQLERPEGELDNLKQIKGIGQKLEQLLHELGVYRFEQIAAWTDDHVAWVDAYLQFPGRIARDDWIAQAKTLSQGGKTAFSLRVDKGDVPTSADDI